MNEEKEKLINFCKLYNIELTGEQIEKFEHFNSLLQDILKTRSFISKNDRDKIFSKHIPDSICAIKCIKNTPKKLIDIGTGIGFPGIILAIMLPDTHFTLVDNSGLKIKYLKSITEEMKLDNTKIICENCEKLAHDKNFREKFDIVTVRALGKLPLICELCIPFLKIGGNFLAYKSLNLDEEIKLAKETIKIAGGEIEDIFEYKIEEDYTRNILNIKKVKKSPDIYPRNKKNIKQELEKKKESNG